MPAHYRFLSLYSVYLSARHQVLESSLSSCAKAIHPLLEFLPISPCPGQTPNPNTPAQVISSPLLRHNPQPKLDRQPRNPIQARCSVPTREGLSGNYQLASSSNP
jgi:hypothetical protein